MITFLGVFFLPASLMHGMLRAVQKWGAGAAVPFVRRNGANRWAWLEAAASA